jgi:asparagine synthase (glutamine-hydrolysing)
LSGGLDSSSIVCATHRLLREAGSGSAHKTFSACSEIKRFDEREYIEKVVAATGVERHYVFPSLKDLFAELDRVSWHQDEPFAGTSIYAQWCVFKLAGEAKMKVMLDGQGADELLFGYPNFRRAFLNGLLRAGHPVTTWREARAARDDWVGAFSGFWRAMVDTATPISLQRNFRSFRRNQRPPSWLAPQALGAAYPGALAEVFNRYTSARELSLELLGGAHLQMLLHWEDRNSMAHSIESRVPFLDYRLVEFVTGLPDTFKIRRGLTKAVLREGMSGQVPQEVLARRDKMGFVTPEEVWARQSGADEFRRALLEARASCNGIVTDEIGKLLEDAIAGRRGYDSAIWRVISLGAWMRRFNLSN